MKILICIWLGALGAVFGSFLGCMGYRIPNKIKTTYPSSFCPNCKNTLKWYMNIPVFSYIFLHGKCAYCKSDIGVIYFICEVMGLVLFPLNYLMFGFDMNFFLATIFDCVLIVTVVSDFLYYYISDRVLIISGLLLIGVQYFYTGPTEMLYTLAGAGILFLVMLGIKILGNSMFGRESLGDGDIKLMAVIALALGVFNSFIVLFFASIIALIFSLITIKRNKEGIIPFGPFLLIGALILIYFGSIINPFVIEFFSL